MPDLASLYVKADTTQVKKADKDLQSLNKTAGKTDKATKKIDKGFASITSTLKRMAPILAAAAATYAGMQIIRVARETEMYNARLKTMTGSMEAANEAFERLNQFARRTPYDLNQSIDAFIKLKALGLDPSEKAMLSYGNTASAMGKSLTQMIEAVADASTNEFERLKEFGIKAKQQGDQVTFTFQGISTTVKKSSEEIQQYLMNIGETQFAGAMDDQMDTIIGQTSNLKMSFDDLWRVFGEGIGASEKIKGALESVSNVIITLKNELTQLFRSIDATKWADLNYEQELLTKSLETYNKLLEDGFIANDGYTKGIEIQKARLEEVNKELNTLGISLGYVKEKETETAETTNTTAEAITKLGTVSATTKIQVSEFEQALNSIRELDIQDVLFDINEAIDSGAISWQEYYTLMEQYGQTAEESLAKVNDTLVETDDTMGDAVLGGVNRMSDAFTDMAFGAEKSFGQMAASIIADISKMIAKQLLFKAISGGLSGTGLGSFFGIAAANGAVFDNGNVVPMASGGLITQPTVFPMANGGIALAGEAGDEVIMPIGRTSDGDMGVKAQMPSGSGTVVNINNYTQAKAITKTTENADGSKTIDVIIEEKVNAAIQGGGLDANMRKTYNSRRVGY